MNLSKESFPGDDSIKHKNESSILNFRSSTSSESSSPSNVCSDFNSNHKSTRDKIIAKLQMPIFKQKSNSYQDLHTDYTRRRYQHVKSKVKEYIATTRSLGPAKSDSKIYCRRSLPETTGDFLNSNTLIVNPTTVEFHSNEAMQKILQEKDKQVEDLSRLNQHLEDNLQEKLTMLAQLKLNADSMRIELLEMKEKQKRASLPNTELASLYHRDSLSTNHRILFEFNGNNFKSAATQTEFRDLNNSEFSEEYWQKLREEYFRDSCCDDSDDFEDGCTLRRRSFSNSMRYEADCESQQSIVSKGKQEDSSTAELNFENLSQIEKRQQRVTSSKLADCKRRPSWQRCITAPCRKVVLCCSQVPDDGNEFIYTKLSAGDITLSSSL